MNNNNPLNYDLNKAYRNEYKQRAAREQQANAVRNNISKKGRGVVKIISQIVMIVKQ